MSERLQRLKDILGEVSDVNRACNVLGWDQETYMPPGGIAHRADQLTTLRSIAHARFTSDEVGELLGEAEVEVTGQPFDSDDASLVRVTRRDYDQARRLSPELVAEIAREGTMARPVWQKAAARCGLWAICAVPREECRAEPSRRGCARLQGSPL